jgi:hypothetical protein
MGRPAKHRIVKDHPSPRFKGKVRLSTAVSTDPTTPTGMRNSKSVENGNRRSTRSVCIPAIGMKRLNWRGIATH